MRWFLIHLVILQTEARKNQVEVWGCARTVSGEDACGDTTADLNTCPRTARSEQREM